MLTQPRRPNIIRHALACAAAACALAACTPAPSTAAPLKAKVLTWNVGNADVLNCNKMYYKLCMNKWEEKVTQGLAEIKPDIVNLQEILDVQWCEKQSPPEKSPKKVCYQYDQQEIRDQARRVLGPGYTIVCDSRARFECTGVRVGFAKVAGCPDGELCREKAHIVQDVPEGCDPLANIFAIDIEAGGDTYRIVNGHPIASDKTCRTGEVQRMFEGYGSVPPLALADRPTLITGDMNLDPFKAPKTDSDILVWDKHVGDGKPFYYLSGPAEHTPPYETDAGRTLDHVVSNFAEGSCVTLGQAPGRPRPAGIPTLRMDSTTLDHDPILCELTFSPVLKTR